MNITQEEEQTLSQVFQPSQQDLFTLLDHLPLMVSIINKELICEFCNKTFLLNKEKQLEKTIGKPIQEICPSSFHIMKKHIQVVLNGVEVTFQEEFTTNNKKCIVNGKFTPRYDNDEKVNGYFSYIEDITSQKNAENELNSYKNNLKELVIEQTKELKGINKDLETFTYSISHDLRTPLRYIEGFSKLLKRKIVIDNEEVERYFSHISEGIQNMSAMIDALLNFSRIGRRNINRRTVDMNEVVEEAITEFTHISSERNIKWKIGKLPMLFVDPVLILMVFENLISNAIKFSKNNNNTLIEIQALETPDEEGKTTIYVKDNGAGFDINYSNKLFGVFQRLHSQEEFEGTGIGLANVKRIVDKHSGSIRIEAEEGNGATFYVTL